MADNYAMIYGDDIEDEAFLVIRRQIAEQLEREVADSTFVKLLLDNAEATAMNALYALSGVDASDTERIRKLQNEVARARDIGRWILTVLKAGEEADEDLRADRAAGDYSD